MCLPVCRRPSATALEAKDGYRQDEGPIEEEVRLDEVEPTSPLWGLQGFNSP